MLNLSKSSVLTMQSFEIQSLSHQTHLAGNLYYLVELHSKQNKKTIFTWQQISVLKNRFYVLNSRENLQKFKEKGKKIEGYTGWPENKQIVISQIRQKFWDSDEADDIYQQISSQNKNQKPKKKLFQGTEKFNMKNINIKRKIKQKQQKNRIQKIRLLEKQKCRQRQKQKQIKQFSQKQTLKAVSQKQDQNQKLKLKQTQKPQDQDQKRIRQLQRILKNQKNQAKLKSIANKVKQSKAKKKAEKLKKRKIFQQMMLSKTKNKIIQKLRQIQKIYSKQKSITTYLEKNVDKDKQIQSQNNFINKQVPVCQINQISSIQQDISSGSLQQKLQQKLENKNTYNLEYQDNKNGDQQVSCGQQVILEQRQQKFPQSSEFLKIINVKMPKNKSRTTLYYVVQDILGETRMINSNRLKQTHLFNVIQFLQGYLNIKK